MTTFLQTTSGAFINARSILQIGAERTNSKGHRYHTLLLDVGDGTQSRDVSDHYLDDMLHRPVHLIPAEPGIKLMYVAVDPDGVIIVRIPLIAWALCLDGAIKPVTAAGVDDNDSRPPFGWFVAFPSGEIADPEGGIHSSDEDVKRTVLEWAELRSEFRPSMAPAGTADADGGTHG